MPPEPPPWDRKDFYKERKHERSESASLGSVARWREQPHHGPRDFVRWGSADFRRPSGHGKEGAWHMFPEESGHGFTPSRSADKMLEDESYRSSVSRGDGKYNRNSRDNRAGSLGQEDWKGQYLETSAVSSSFPSRQLDMNVQRSVNDSLTYASHPHSDFVNTRDQLHFKDQYDKTGTINGLGACQRSDRENSLGSIDWKPLKWARSGSLSSRGSGFSHSSSSRSTAVDTFDTKTDSQPRNVTPVQSPLGDAAPCPTSVAPSEETSSRKKQRLGWGEGLAKYEKKKVEGPDESVSKNADSVHFIGSNLALISPRVTGFSDCGSPATPSSVACSSSPGMEEKSFIKAMSVGNETSNLCGSSGSVFQHHLEKHPINLQNLELSSIANLSSSIVELLQSDDISLVGSNVARSTATNKLLVWKGDMLKALEMTESEIDQLENELKSLNSESEIGCPYAAASSSLPAEGKAKSRGEHIAASNLIPRPSQLHFFSENIYVDTMNGSGGAPEDVNVVTKDDDIDSPGTATSKFVDPLKLGDAASPSYLVKHGECFGDLEASRLKSIEVVHSNEENFECEGIKKFTDSETADPYSGGVGLCADEGNMLCDILSSNKGLANRSSEIFNKLLPKAQCHVDVSEASKIACWQYESLIKQKFMMKKQFLRFKERVASLKFRILLRLWKEDMHLLSIRKYHAKSQKKFELSSRTPHIGVQRHQSSIRSQSTSPSGNSLTPTTEIINFAGKLLRDTQAKHYRNTLKMPALVLDKKEKMMIRFISSNGLVEDPCAVENERVMINPWTSEEKETFMDKLGIFGKDFRKIATFLDHKNIADCVEFYYKNHKSDCFAKAKKKLEYGKQGKSLPSNTYLLTSGKNRNRDLDAASLDMLGAASVLASRTDGTLCSDERSTSFNIHGNDDKEAAAADVLAGICGSLASEVMSSCITSSVDCGHRWEYQKVGSVTEYPYRPKVMQNVDDETCSDESCGEMDSADWTDDEKSIFVRAVSSYGKDFAMISRCLRRSRNECKVFFSKARKCLGLDLIHPVLGTERIPLSDDANGSGSEAEDAYLLETGSVICSSKSGSKMDVDLPSDPGENMVLQTDLNIEEKNWHGKAKCEDFKSIVDLIHDECQADDKPKQILDCDFSSTVNVGKSVTSHVQQTATSPSVMEGPRDEATAEVASVEEPPSLVAGEAPSRLDVLETEVLAYVSVAGHRPESAVEKLVLPRNGLTDRWDEKEESDANTNGQDAFHGSLQKSKSVGGTSHLNADTRRLSSSLGFLECHPNRFPELDCTLKFPVISLQQDSSLLIANGTDCNSAASRYEKSPNRYDCSSTFGFEEKGVKKFKNTASTESNQQCKVEDPLVDHVEFSQILQGYLLHMPAKKVMNGDINKPATLPILQRCNASNAHRASAQMQLPSRNLEPSSDQPRAHERSSSDMEKPSRNNDVKLFGQILSHPSSSPKANVSSHENEIPGAHRSKLISKSFNLKFAGYHNVDDNSTSSKFDQNNYKGLESLPVRSYGFWDGNRIQTRFPSLPDSAILLAKYPAAFRNVPASASKMEQQPLQAVIKSTEENLNGVPVFSAREMSSSNGVADFQAYRSQESSTKVLPPFIVDMKHRQDIYSEVQRRNGFEAVSSLQQQVRAMVGMNVVGTGGILVGGTCSGVSDPVAAMKMHYAKTDQFVGQVGGREEETWRDAGDIGR